MSPREVNFGYLPEEFSNYNDARVIILPVPYDETSTWVKGADAGPEAIIDASVNLEMYDIETGVEAYRIGICTDTPLETHEAPADMVDDVRHRVADYLADGKFSVVLGGEHSVSIGSIRAHAKVYENLTVLQLDAHSDLRPEYLGTKYNHACVMARAREVAPIVQVGIRSMDVIERQFLVPENVFYARDIVGRTDWIDRVVSRLTQNVYVTIDLDVFDPSIMPSTGTPEPGGLDYYPVLDLLRAVAKQHTIVGFDVVELCPTKDNHAPDFLAARLIYQLLSYRFQDELPKAE